MVLEYGYTSFNKYGEELCGDSVAINDDGNYLTIILADGLGSGVKASILSTLTSKILCTMISNNVPIEDCVATMIDTLPVCKQRGIAYSTFSIVHVDKNGKGSLFEFDNPSCIYLRRNEPIKLNKEKIEVLGRTIYRYDVELCEQDVLVMMSDGVPHAGIGKILNLGWQEDIIRQYLEDHITEKMSARNIACQLASASEELYMHEPYDDTTVVAIKMAKEKTVNIMIGPPADKKDDSRYVKDFISTDGVKVICGGTTSQIVADYLGKKVNVILNEDDQLPPIASIEGIDLVTEGVLTLNRLIDLSDTYLKIDSNKSKSFEDDDGASRLADLLFEQASNINFFVGQAINEAYRDTPIDTSLKFKLVDRLIDNLKLMNKKISVKYY